MEIERTEAFKRDFQKLPNEIKRRVEKALRLLASNPHHPSLHAKIIDPRVRMWQARATRGHRLYFTMEKGVITLHRVKAHD